MNLSLLAAVLFGIVFLLVLILKCRLPAFLALLLTSMITGLMAGMEPTAIIETVRQGMGSTLGFVATVIGLGAILGGILEHTGGAQVLAQFILSKLGEDRAPWAMLLTGLLVSIPVFFDVGFIILFPMIVAIHRRSGKSIVHYAVPLLAGLAVAHSFIPPTPGPLAVAEILGAPLGWVVLIGLFAGLPTAYISGIVYGKFLGDRLIVEIPADTELQFEKLESVGIGRVLPIVLLPLILIVFSTFIDSGFVTSGNHRIDQLLSMVCHPFSALIIANVVAWYLLGRGAGFTAEQLSNITAKSLYPVGMIILVTGAGGVYKEVLINTGAGTMIAEGLQGTGLGILPFAFVAAAAIRIIQGSATVAMITGAGLVAPLLDSFELSPIQLAAIVISVASGATSASHLNDSGFWLVKEYLRINEKQGMLVWTVTSTILGFSGFLFAAIAFYLFG